MKNRRAFIVGIKSIKLTIKEKLLLKNQRELLLKANKTLEKIIIHLKKTR